MKPFWYLYYDPYSLNLNLGSSDQIAPSRIFWQTFDYEVLELYDILCSSLELKYHTELKNHPKHFCRPFSSTARAAFSNFVSMQMHLNK